MSRKLMRVPLDFKWPLNKVWDGYLNPHEVEKCRACNGSGYSSVAALYHDQWYGHPHNTGDDRGSAIRPFVPFDPAAYGVPQLRIDDPFFVEATRRKIERSKELNGYDWYGERGGLVRELHRMHEMLREQWCHHLNQADVDALVAEGRLHDLTHAWTQESGWQPRVGYRPTAEEVNHWSLSGLAHDSINSWVCIRARCRREGVFYNFAWCHGNGEFWSSDEARQRHEGWESSGPPVGAGYQLWETCSEGSPVSPVFASLEEFCAHAEKHCSTFGSDNFVSKDRWREMLDSGFVFHQEGNAIFI